MTAPVPRLSPLDARIVGALQVDGRASWRSIAEVLDRPERTVTRRGRALLDSGVVTVSGLSVKGEGLLLRGRCAPGTARLTGAALAARGDTVFTYLLTGSADCVAEVYCEPRDLAGLTLEGLPSTAGLLSCTCSPVLRYYRTVAEWRADLLTDEEATELTRRRGPVPPTELHGTWELTTEDEGILRALAEDGRRTCEELARYVGVSEPTARRRLESLRQDGRTYIRAVVDPAVLGLPVEAMLWIRTPPQTVDTVGAALVASPYVRYACALMGEYQLLADVVAPGLVALHDFTTSGAWPAMVDSLESSLVVAALKRSGVRTAATG